jgi:UDP-N-acetylglucosamine 2-epimerase (non-hydrolysing)
VGTRPEALKLAPVVRALKEPGRAVTTQVCFSGQHAEMLHRIALEVDLAPDFDLGSMGFTGSLSENLAGILERLDRVFLKASPEGAIVQGDTTTALAAALAAFHRNIPVFHVEAGLRTKNPSVPFPEEMNRRLVSRLATLHFAATEPARDNLLREGVRPASITVTGNPIVDTLNAFGRSGGAAAEALLGAEPRKRRILITLHRRENAAHAGAIARAVSELSRRGDLDIIWIRHPNATSHAALEALGGMGEAKSVRVLDPLPYATFVAVMQRARVVLTDSGGVQEEAPVLRVPVVVLRDETDRPEAVLSGNALVAGSDVPAILRACDEFLGETDARARAQIAESPFGDGHAAARIALGIENWYKARS